MGNDRLEVVPGDGVAAEPGVDGVDARCETDGPSGGCLAREPGAVRTGLDDLESAGRVRSVGRSVRGGNPRFRDAEAAFGRFRAANAALLHRMVQRDSVKSSGVQRSSSKCFFAVRCLA